MEIIASTPHKGQWGDLCNFWGKWWYKPDTQALRVILSSVICHYDLAQPPVWFMLVGPPGSGKTSIAIEMISFLPEVQQLDSPSINAFLSGFQDKGGLLKRMSKVPGSPIKRHGILTYSDFSTMLHMREDVRNELMAIHRCLFDGKYTKPVGNKDDLSWKGKCTVVAACTPEVDNYYRMWGALGQRFLMVRWPLDTGLEGYTEAAYKQIGNEKEINAEFKDRVRRYTQGVTKSAGVEMPEEMRRKIGKLAIMVCQFRGNVPKQQVGLQKVVTGEASEEAPTRLAMSLSQLAKASAKLARSNVARAVDFRLAQRAAIDSVPHKRWRVINQLPVGTNGHSEAISLRDLREYTGQNRYEFISSLQDLEASKIVTMEEEGEEGQEEKMVWLTELGRGLLLDSGVTTRGLVGYRIHNH